MTGKYKIYDDRNNQTLYIGEWKECMEKIKTVDEEDERFSHLWVEEMEGGE